MKTEPGNIYHVYNQGNRRQLIFFSDENYLDFLRLVRKYVKPCCELLAYCLMPNHFHFLILSNEKSCAVKPQGNITSTYIANAFRMLQSTYAQQINAEQKEHGSLFKQKAKAKLVEGNNEYLRNLMYYIHQNPVRAGLVEAAEEWKYSSCLDLGGIRKGTLCNLVLAYRLFSFEPASMKKTPGL